MLENKSKAVEQLLENSGNVVDRSPTLLLFYNFTTVLQL
jgi:hypothetical protein